MVRRTKAKVNKTGRNSNGSFVPMTSEVLNSPAFKALSSHAKALYPYIKIIAYGDRNGRVRFTVREVMDALGVAKNTANDALHDLQAKGFLVLTQYGVLGTEGSRLPPLYAVTEYRINPALAPLATYREWKEGQDFPVHKHPTNNPNGWNGKTHLKS